MAWLTEQNILFHESRSDQNRDWKNVIVNLLNEPHIHANSSPTTC